MIIKLKSLMDGKVDIYKIVSPGIGYFIVVNLYCNEMSRNEAHLYGSLSYSKYTLIFMKFGVDNVGINSQMLSISKLPVRVEVSPNR